MDRGLDVGAASGCNASSSQPVRHCALWKSRLREMTCQHLGLRLGETVLTCLKTLGDPRMQLLPSHPEEHSVRDILHERMFENVCRMRWGTAGEKKAGCYQAAEGRLQIG